MGSRELVNNIMSYYDPLSYIFNYMNYILSKVSMHINIFSASKV